MTRKLRVIRLNESRNIITTTRAAVFRSTDNIVPKLYVISKSVMQQLKELWRSVMWIRAVVLEEISDNLFAVTSLQRESCFPCFLSLSCDEAKPTLHSYTM